MSVTGVIDGAGRRFHLVLTTQAQRAAQAAYATAGTSGTSRSAFVDFPEALPATEYGTDNGVRLLQVWLTYEPETAGKDHQKYVFCTNKSAFLFKN
ncbi:hypothetical protein ABOZ96_000901 [Salmonella enterica]